MAHSARIFLSDNTLPMQGGVKRCFRQLVDGVVAAYGERTVVYSPERRDYGRARFMRSPGWPGRVHDTSASLAATLCRADVLLAAYYGTACGPGRRVYAVYDMIHELLPHYFPPQTAYERRFVAEKRHCLLSGDRLIAISHSTAQDVLALYPDVNPGRIVVAHLGVDDSFFGAHPWPGAPPARPYLLYVGQRSAYKNFRRLLEAFGEAGLARSCDLRVISAEFGGFTPDEQALIARYGLEQVVHLRLKVSDAELAAHYQGAVALVYPSEYEGFGLPIVEAMAAGTVVATAGRSSMPEAGGSVAFYFDPTSVGEMAGVLTQVAGLPAPERARRIAAGVARAREFSWRRFQQTVNAALEPLLLGAPQGV